MAIAWPFFPNLNVIKNLWRWPRGIVETVVLNCSNYESISFIIVITYF